ncbi:MAG: ABC transporter ATP-binding protein [Planctomycetaceae bacterium]
MNASVLACSRVEKSLGGKRVLDELSFTVAPGVVTVLLGSNGAGKTTLFRLALGLLRPEAGEMEVCGFDPAIEASALRKVVGYVPDNPDVYPWMTPRDLYRFLRPQYPTWSETRALDVAGTLAVPLDRPFSALSRGEGMKAMLAAALAPDPQLLLLDEPFAGLDPLVRDEVLRGVIGEVRDGRRTTLCATHDLDVAARIADQVAILARGAIAQHGSLAAILGSEAEPSRAPARIHELLAAAERGEATT